MTKEKISITIDEELLEWIDDKIKEKRFANRSHAFEYALSKLVDE